MNKDPRTWDYLIITASNKKQAESYEKQLDLRSRLGLLPGVDKALVVQDPYGKRVGSGGSTIFSLLHVLSREIETPCLDKLSPGTIEDVLDRRRILIIHAGGDSRRLPAYGPCGKIFTPIPGSPGSVHGHTIFDRQFPIYSQLPSSVSGRGQTVVTTGDVLLFFSPETAKFEGNGVTGLGCYVSPELAKYHGVFCADQHGEVKYFLQKASVSQQKEKGAIDDRGRSLLDIGVMELDPGSATKLITLCDIAQKDENFHWTGPFAEEILSKGLDFYGEVCCAMGKEVRFENFLKTVRRGGCRLSESFLVTLFDTMSQIPFHAHPLENCTFLHFGTPRQLIEMGAGLLEEEGKKESGDTCLSINNRIDQGGWIKGQKSWVEGCRVLSELKLAGENVVAGADVDAPVSLPEKTCLDIIQGRDRSGKNVWFVRIYGIDDSFKTPVEAESVVGNLSYAEWTERMQVSEKEFWEPALSPYEKKLWNAKIFPAVTSMDEFHRWLWMADPSGARPDQIRAWHKADRYSLAEISNLVDPEVFFRRRQQNRADEIRSSLGPVFKIDSRFSAADLALIFEISDEAGHIDWVGRILKEGLRGSGLIFSRIIHTLGSAIELSFPQKKQSWTLTLQAMYENLDITEKKRLDSLGLDSYAFNEAQTFCEKARDCAFDNMGRTIVRSEKKPGKYPSCAIQPGETIMGRAPARLDLGGGWTDTPPYALEHGGCVINAAVDLNGEPPISVLARILEKPEIRLLSVDHDMRAVIKDLADLMDYRKAGSTFGLAKAALVLSGFSLDASIWPRGVETLENMLESFGGGIELTTSAAIPSGSGLGTSSIMGAVLISVISKLIGRERSQRELFNLVLQLEQELTTGGGWQDQIGGTIAGVKMITTGPGLVPDPEICPVMPDLLDPALNDGQTLLYYTGMRRLAKNILRNIVGHYLDRDRATMDALGKLRVFPPLLVNAMERKDMLRFGELIDRALRLKKEIDPGSSNPGMEKILEKFEPFMSGATFLGAGGGGFLLVVGKSPEHASEARKVLERDPPNAQARFFDYAISTSGLEITVNEKNQSR